MSDRTEDDSETSSDSETTIQKLATLKPDSETHPIQKLADSETTGVPSIQKLADSETIRFRNWGLGGWGGDLMTGLC